MASENTLLLVSRTKWTHGASFCCGGLGRGWEARGLICRVEHLHGTRHARRRSITPFHPYNRKYSINKRSRPICQSWPTRACLSGCANENHVHAEMPTFYCLTSMLCVLAGTHMQLCGHVTCPRPSPLLPPLAPLRAQSARMECMHAQSLCHKPLFSWWAGAIALLSLVHV